MSDLNWTQVRHAAEEERIEMSCMHGTSCHDVLCVERQARAECLATAAEVLADLGPVLDALVQDVEGDIFEAGTGEKEDRIRRSPAGKLVAAWTIARAKLVTL